MKLQKTEYSEVLKTMLQDYNRDCNAIDNQLNTINLIFKITLNKSIK